MASNPKTLLTPEEYLATERRAGMRSEYFAGEVFAMAGASRRHNRIVSNLVIRLGVQLDDSPCNIYANDMKVRVSRTGLFTYPDVVVTCGEESFADEERDVLLNPLLVIEVLSDSTEAYDRGKKFWHYQQIESLAEYVLVSQDVCKVERYVRQADGRWLYSKADAPEDVMTFDAINCGVSLKDIYARVEWRAAPTA